MRTAALIKALYSYLGRRCCVVLTGTGVFAALGGLAEAKSLTAAGAVAGDWKLKQEPHSCSIESPIAGTRHQKLTFALAPAHDGATMSIVGKGRSIGEEFRLIHVDVILIPSGFRMNSAGMRSLDPRTKEQVFSVWELSEAFINEASRASAVMIERKGRRVLQIELTGIGKSISHLRACNEMLLTQWGVNPRLVASLKQKPKPLKGVQLVQSEDYPAESVQRREQGKVVVRYTVGIDGRVTNCTPVISSGFAALDAQTCKSVLKRARFEPALDKQGRKTAAESVASVQWALGH